MLNKYTFPKERIFQFNDAVFSIAITLLVLDLQIPSYEEFSERGFAMSLRYLVPDFIGFFVDYLDARGPFTFYCANLVLLGLVLYILTRIVLKRAKIKIDPVDAEWLRFRGLWAVVFWLVFFVLSFFIGSILVLCIPSIFVVQFFAKLYYNRKKGKYSK